MNCEHCGKQNEEGARTCYYCGGSLVPAAKIPGQKSQQGTSARQIAGAKKNPSYYTGKGASEELENRKSLGKEDNSESKILTREEESELEEELRQLEKGKVRDKKRDGEKGKKTGISKLISITLEVLVLVAILTVLVTRIPKLYGSEAEAEAFETAVLSGKWEEAYGHLNLPEDTGVLSMENYIAVMNRKGATGFREMEVAAVDKTTVSAVYQTSEGQKEDIISLEPVGKKLLLLNDWKVKPDSICVSNITIVIPDEMELLLNGKNAGVTPQADEVNGTLSYTFDRLFCGSWDLGLTEERRVPYHTMVELSKEHENGTVSLVNIELEPDQDMKQEILNQFTADYQAILEASVNREDFSSVQKYFTEQAIQEGRAGNMYANACSQAYDPERNSGILKYELSDISADFVSIGKSGYAKKGDLVLEVHSAMSYTYIEAGIEKIETKESTGLLCYHQEDGQWKIQSFS